MSYKLELPGLPPRHPRILVSRNQEAGRGITVFTGINNTDQQGKLELMLHNGSREEYMKFG